MPSTLVGNELKANLHAPDFDDGTEHFAKNCAPYIYHLPRVVTLVIHRRVVIVCAWFKFVYAFFVAFHNILIFLLNNKQIIITARVIYVLRNSRRHYAYFAH